jgi:hypothetical protein
MGSAELPPCGCRSGCEHLRHPQFPAQRACKAGVEPWPTTGPAGANAPTLDEGVALLAGVVRELAPAVRALLAGLESMAAVHEARNANTAVQSQLHLRKHGEQP